MTRKSTADHQHTFGATLKFFGSLSSAYMLSAAANALSKSAPGTSTTRCGGTGVGSASIADIIDSCPYGNRSAAADKSG